jgi:hypothetical protein
MVPVRDPDLARGKAVVWTCESTTLNLPVFHLLTLSCLCRAKLLGTKECGECNEACRVYGEKSKDDWVQKCGKWAQDHGNEGEEGLFSKTCRPCMQYCKVCPALRELPCIEYSIPCDAE